jgi:hypothetical protein
MLTKLLKYEGKALFGSLLPFYGALILFILLEMVFFALDVPSVILLLRWFQICILCIVGVYTLVVITRRFRRSFFSDEGYLTFTLPVPTWELLAAKLIIAIAACFASLIISGVTLSFLLLTTPAVGIPFGTPPILMLALNNGGHLSMIITEFAEAIVEFLLDVVGYNVVLILLIYHSITLGRLAGNNRTLVSIGCFLGLFVLAQGISFSLGTNFGSIAFVISVALFAWTNYLLQHNLNLA